MAVDVEIDVELLKSEIKKTYASVSEEPEQRLHLPDRARLGGRPRLPGRAGERAGRRVESFAGVANPWALGRLAAGERVLDLGSGAGTDSLIAAQMVGEEGRVTGIDMTPEMLAKARAAAAEMGRHERRVRRGRGRAAAVPGRELRRRHLERRDRPDPRQGRRLRRALPRARARRSDPDRRRDDPEPGQRGRQAQHRPLDRLNCRGAAGSSVREAPRTARLRADRDRPARRHLRPLQVRGHAPQGAEVRRPRHDPQGVQAHTVSRRAVTPVLDPEGAHLAALHRLGDFRGRRVLELGCGDGRLTRLASPGTPRACSPSTRTQRRSNALAARCQPSCRTRHLPGRLGEGDRDRAALVRPGRLLLVALMRRSGGRRGRPEQHGARRSGPAGSSSTCK